MATKAASVPIRVVKLRDDAVLPVYQTAGAAGADIRACLDEPVTLQPMERQVIPTGLMMAIPEGCEVQIRARSGLSIAHGITMINGIGTIDADYRGELSVLVINLGNEPFVVEPGMRIAQMVLARYEQVAWQEVAELDQTARLGGLGSSGVH